MKTIFIPGPVGALEAIYAEKENSPLMVICHPHPLFQGAMQNKVVTTLAQAAANSQCASLRFNFRGVGKSEGAYAQAIGEQDDLRAVIQWAINILLPPSIILAGFSFGSFISAKVAASYNFSIPLNALMSIAPPVGNFPFETLESISVPWLCVQGDEDEVVSFERVQQWATSRQDISDFIVFKQCSHFFHGRLVELRETVQGWLTKLELN